MKEGRGAHSDFQVQLKLRTLNPFIVCSLCAGYYVDATTIKECLHTFCKSCIVKYLQDSKQCPTCNQLIHETEPLSRIKLDRTMQEIVNKLIPNIKENEENRRDLFELERKGSPSTSSLASKPAAKSKKHQLLSGVFDFSNTKANYHEDEQINLLLEMDSAPASQEDLAPFQNSRSSRHVRCSVRTRVWQLKKLIRKLHSQPQDRQLVMKCCGGDMPDPAPLKFVVLARWRRKVQPVVIRYHFVDTCSQNLVHTPNSCDSTDQSSVLLHSDSQVTNVCATISQGPKACSNEIEEATEFHENVRGASCDISNLAVDPVSGVLASHSAISTVSDVTVVSDSNVAVGCSDIESMTVDSTEVSLPSHEDKLDAPVTSLCADTVASRLIYDGGSTVSSRLIHDGDQNSSQSMHDGDNASPRSIRDRDDISAQAICDEDNSSSQLLHDGDKSCSQLNHCENQMDFTDSDAENVTTSADFDISGR